MIDFESEPSVKDIASVSFAEASHSAEYAGPEDAKRRRVDIKVEPELPDDSCVLPTDYVVQAPAKRLEATARPSDARNKVSRTKV